MFDSGYWYQYDSVFFEVPRFLGYIYLYKKIDFYVEALRHNKPLKYQKNICKGAKDYLVHCNYLILAVNNCFLLG